MKPNIYIATMSILFFLSFSLLGCSKTEKKEIEGITLRTEDANFTVNNITTKESAKNQGKLDNPDRLIVHSGDILELTYTPKKEYEHTSWEVTFELAGDKILNNNSYTAQYIVTDLTPGKYIITCTSEMQESISDESFVGLQEIGYVYIEIVSN